MLKEERQIIPVANRVLNADDWAEIESAFASHRDPLAGVSSEMDADQLFRRIVMLVPAPYGVGAPIEP
jgi:replicative DNA helicase